MEKKGEKRFSKNILSWAPFIYILRKEWEGSGENSDEDNMIRDRIWEGVYKNIHKRNIWKSRYFLLKATGIVAASVLICFFTSRSLFPEKSEEVRQPNILLIAATESKTCQLPDGTKVRMEAGSELRLPENFTENRELWLTGNSTFEVVKQSKSSFKVHLTNSFVEVKSTSFFINQDIPEANIIALYSGKINLVQEKNKKTIELLPSQRIIYNSIEVSSQVVPIYENIHWKNGYYRLSEINLTDLVNFLDWKYSTRIELEKLPRKSFKVTGNIRYDEPLEAILNKISYSLNLKYKLVDKKYIMHR